MCDLFRAECSVSKDDPDTFTGVVRKPTTPGQMSLNMGPWP